MASTQYRKLRAPLTGAKLDRSGRFSERAAIAQIDRLLRLTLFLSDYKLLVSIR